MRVVNIIIAVLISISLSAEIVHYSQLPVKMQNRVVPDLEGKVLINDLDSQLEKCGEFTRELPSVVTGWPVSYTGSNCKNGAIYVNMDADDDLEILFGVGTKITALNLDGTTVPGWPVQLSYYIWSSPAAGDIDGDGIVEIVCTSRNNTTGNEGALYAFELDGTACTGFPVTQSGGGTNNVCLFDLDGNGDLEILVNERNHPQGWVYVYDGDGTVLPGWPQELDYIPGAGISTGDITGDGVPEIVALSYNSLHVYDVNGNILDGFPLTNTGYNYSYSQPIIFDLDGDGYREIIWGGCSSSAGAVFAINSDASSVTGWPNTTGQWVFGTVSLGDVDQDGNIDVVVGDQVASGTPMDYIYAWDAAGNDIAGFPAGPTNAIYAQIGIADLDGDNNVELMIDDNNFGFGYDAYNHDGTHLQDWPIECGTSMYSTTMQITPAFGDVDNDGELEIIGAATDIMNWVVECYLWDTDSAWNEDLAYMIIDGVNIQHNGLYDPSSQSSFNPPQNFMVDNYGLATWEAPLPDDLLGYNIYLDGVLVGFSEDTFWDFDDGSLISGQTYTAGIQAVYENGTSVMIEYEFTYDPTGGPIPPFNLEAIVVDYNDVLLTWESPINQISDTRSLAGYNIYQDGVQVGQVDDPATLEYLVESLNAGTYEFTITAYYINPGGESIPTDPVSATVVLNPPINVDANSQPPNIIITWEAPNRGIDSYNVYRDDVLIAEGITGLMFIDINISLYHYWNITAVYEGGYESEFSETVGAGSATDPNLMPLVTALYDNYPNPFNPETTISFSTTETEINIQITIYNLKGQRIKTLVNETLPTGDHSVIWNGTDENNKKVSSGIYLYKMQAGDFESTKRMILLK